MSMTRFHSEKYTLPVVAMLAVREQWQVSMSRSDDPVFSFVRKRKSLDRRRSEDAFNVRRDFLSIRSPEDALRFFERYGPFQFLPRSQAATKTSESVRADSWKWSKLQQARQNFEQALLAEGIPVEKAWLYEFMFTRPLILELPFRAVTSLPTKRADSHIADGIEDAAIAPCEDVVDALRASIFISRMGGFQWSRCARKGCEQLFEQTTRRRKLYCSPECAHLQAVNDYNARQKKPHKPTSQKPQKGRKP
ncbi:MAG: hypothetical protein ACYCO5_10330 [Acidobacteriaceae bacterium]